MGNHEPAALVILEYVGHEGIEDQDIAFLSEKLNLLDPNRPCALFWPTALPAGKTDPSNSSDIVTIASVLALFTAFSLTIEK
jgi:hypothetical protein